MTAESRPIRVEAGHGGGAEGEPRHSAATAARAVPEGQTPLIDIHEGADGLTLEADLPGAREDRLTIQLEDNVLTLVAQADQELPEGARVLHQEYRVGTFRRSFILSDEVDRNAIAAELKNGVLRLTLPKAERAKTRRIEVRT